MLELAWLLANPLVGANLLLGIISISFWIVLFVGYLFGKNKEDISQYFRAMIAGFARSEVRVGWKSIILAIEYVIGLYAMIIVETAWNLAQGIRWVMSKIVFSSKREDRIEREQFADKKEEE